MLFRVPIPGDVSFQQVAGTPEPKFHGIFQRWSLGRRVNWIFLPMFIEGPSGEWIKISGVL